MGRVMINDSRLNGVRRREWIKTAGGRKWRSKREEGTPRIPAGDHRRESGFNRCILRVLSSKTILSPSILCSKGSLHTFRDSFPDPLPSSFLDQSPSHLRRYRIPFGRLARERGGLVFLELLRTFWLSLWKRGSNSFVLIVCCVYKFYTAS